MVGGATPPDQPLIEATPEEKKPRKKTGSSVKASTSGTDVVDFVNDPARFGTPTQNWKLSQKAMWTIFVVGELKGTRSLSAGLISRTFNKHFRQTGQIRPSNVSRDLGKLKVKDGEMAALVGEDTTKTPSEWFLQDAGLQQVRQLIAQSIGA
jgi:hypothetical protein